MHKNIARVVVVMAAGAALTAAGVSGASAKGAGAKGTAPAVGPPAVRVAHAPPAPGTKLWVKRYNSGGKRDDWASSVAVSPDGGRVFVTGQSTRRGAGYGPGNSVTAAYSARTGARLWIRHYDGPGTSYDRATSVAVSPGGGRVFVTGTSNSTQGGPSDYVTMAYRAATGARLWVKRYSGRGFSDDGTTSLAVSPNGKTVFVTGYSGGPTANSEDAFATIAYSAATGAWQWGKRYSGPGNRGAAAAAVAVSPGGGRVFVTGGSRNDYATVAYNARTGARLWVMGYPGFSEPRYDLGGGYAVAVSPGGKTVFVTGAGSGPNLRGDYATIAYNAATGAQLWATHYSGPGDYRDRASSLAVSPGGEAVFVTGGSNGAYGTVAYNAVTGAQLWVKRYNGPGSDDSAAAAVAVSPNGTTVFVTGSSSGATSDGDYATVAYRATTGGQLWVRRYNGPGNGTDGAVSIAVSPRGNSVFVTGNSYRSATSWDIATIAYHS